MLKKFILQPFSSDINDQDLKSIYDLNQANVPEVGSLEDTSALSELIRMSSFNLSIKLNDEIVGYIICFKEGSKYQSLNYKFFQESIDEFLYIDRVAIKDGFRGQGLGTMIYDSIYVEANKINVPLLCEVNTRPVNEPSLKFHAKMGFKECGTNDFSYNSVVYLRRDNGA
jgi:hypothetical protein